MNLPGLLVEYLISGGLALLWLVPMLMDDWATNWATKLGPAAAGTLLVVLAYVVGMTVDFLAYWLVKPIKPLVWRLALENQGKPGDSFQSFSMGRQVRLALHAPELWKEVRLRSSRDRIARGAVVNALLAAVMPHKFSIFSEPIYVVYWGLLIGLLIVMWASFEYVSCCYELNADHALDLKEKRS